MGKKLLHYGLQRSGTNFIESLLKKNFNVKFLNRDERDHPLKKHFRLYDDKTKIPEAKYLNNYHYKSFEELESSFGLKAPVDGIIIISKDPYSWLLSYEKWGEKCQWPNPDYNYIEEYVLFLNKWKQFSEESEKIHFIKYIDLLTDPELILNEIKSQFQIEKKFRLFKKTITELKKVDISETFTEQKKNYYVEKEYLNQYNSKKLKKVNSLLNKKLMEFLDYKIIDE